MGLINAAEMTVDRSLTVTSSITLALSRFRLKDLPRLMSLGRSFYLGYLLKYYAHTTPCQDAMFIL